MKRRDFLKTSIIPPLLTGCSREQGIPDGRSIVDTPEKRASYLSGLLKELCTDLGPHPVGSPEYIKAAEIFKREMERSLPSVFLDEFTFERWVLRSEPEFSVGGRSIEAYPGHGTSGTPPEGITGVIREIEEEKVKYGIVDKDSGELLAYISNPRYDLAVALPYYTIGKEAHCLPTINVGKRDFHLIEDAIRNKTLARLQFQADFIPDTRTCNVVGTIPGESPDEMLFLAHLDTVYSSPGANDNTASAIVMLMLAHAFSGVKPKKTLTFVATAAEEYDKLGAIHYADGRKAAGSFADIKYLVNFDSLTWGTDMQINTHDGELRALIGAIDRDLNLTGTPNLKDGDGFALDGRPFRDEGIRAMYVNSLGYDTVAVWHRPEDTADSVPVDCAEIGFLMFSDYLRRIHDL